MSMVVSVVSLAYLTRKVVDCTLCMCSNPFILRRKPATHQLTTIERNVELEMMSVHYYRFW